jgi:hypothetical protein
VDVLHQQLARDEVPRDWQRVNASEGLRQVQEFAESFLREKLAQNLRTLEP